MKRMLALIVTAFFIFTGFTPEAKAVHKNKNENINLNCIAGVVIDQESGRVLYSKNGTMVLPMASTTKIVTAIVALEKGNLKDIVTVSKRAAAIHGSTIGLKEGQKLTLEELLYGLMLKSGNDAAIAIAEHLGNGKVENFVKLMNEKAMELGALHTSFATPHGLDKENHYTTGEDLAKLTAYAMKNPTFAKIVSTKEISSGVSGEFTQSYRNINKFLYRIESADGVKTGYTGNAGKCLVASVKHPYGRYICVVLNSGDRWSDAEKLQEYANQNYKFVKVMSKDESVKKFKIYGGTKRYISCKTDKNLYLPVKTDEVSKYSVDIYAPSAIFAPVKVNEPIGNIVVFINNKIVAKYTIKSDTNVNRRNFVDTVKQMMAVY